MKLKKEEHEGEIERLNAQIQDLQTGKDTRERELQGEIQQVRENAQNESGQLTNLQEAVRIRIRTFYKVNSIKLRLTSSIKESMSLKIKLKGSMNKLAT